MKLAIMQPYLFPYIGYFQLINAVDIFVIYDNVQYIKSGWINRNRLLVNDNPCYFTLSLKKDSTYTNINDRYFSDRTIERDKKKFLKSIEISYSKSPYFKEVFPIINECVRYEEKNLSKFLENSLKVISDYLLIKTCFKLSSCIPNHSEYTKQMRVLQICNTLKADCYINVIGGKELYCYEDFADQQIKLYFLKTDEIKYRQFKNEFVSNLSIIDVMMFNSVEEIKKMLTLYQLV